MDIRFTTKQIDILSTLSKLEREDKTTSIYDIMENLEYPVKRDALRHSIKILIDNGFIIQKYYLGHRMNFGVTERVKNYIG